ncbi:MAG TPA: PLP-dependent aminotransferase family protein, partial [Capillimicrobium sp.]
MALDREAPASLRAQLEAGLREAIRAGRLAAGARMPASRTLAADLGVSRRLVVEVYAQLAAERWLEARTGSGTFVARDAAGYAAPAAQPQPGPPRYDFFPGSPALGAFPRSPWARALREALRELPDRRLGYGDIRGTAEAREELAAYLRRARAVTASADAVLTCAGTTGGLALVATVLVRAGRRRVAVEDPSLPHLRALTEAAGAETVSVPVDDQGIDVEALARTGADAVLVTPGHQFPTGIALGPERRGALVEWAGGGRLVIEDDYNAEFRYDRPAVGALQGLAPDRVVYLGSASKALAPALRLGWVVAPADLVGPLAQAKLYSGHGPGALEEHALASVLRRGE